MGRDAPPTGLRRQGLKGFLIRPDRESIEKGCRILQPSTQSSLSLRIYAELNDFYPTLTEYLATRKSLVIP